MREFTRKDRITLIVVFIVQMLTLYGLPLLSSYPNSDLDMMSLMLLTTYLLSKGIKPIFKSNLKYLYSVTITVLFIPSVLIFDVSTALILAFLVLITSAIGITTNNTRNNFIILTGLQILNFYMLPLDAKQPGDEPVMVIAVFIVSFILSLCLGVSIESKIKYIYPVIVAIIFVPSVFIFVDKYDFINSYAIILPLLHLVASAVGILFGASVSLILNSIKSAICKDKKE